MATDSPIDLNQLFRRNRVAADESLLRDLLELVKHIQRQQQTIADLESRIQALENP